MTKNHKNLSEHEKYSEAVLKKKASKALTIKEKAIRWVFLAAGVYLAGEMVATKFSDDDTQFSIQKEGDECHLNMRRIVGNSIWTHEETNEKYSWKVPIDTGNPVSLSRTINKHVAERKAIVDPVSGKARRWWYHFEIADTIVRSSDTGIISDPNNTVLQWCTMERKLDLSWCEYGINPWNICSPVKKTRTEIKGIINSGILIDDTSFSVLWWYNLIEALRKNPSKNQEVRLKQGEAIYRAVTQGGLSLGELVQLPKEYQALESVKASIAFIKKQFYERAKNGALSFNEQDRIRFYKEIKILPAKEANELLEANEKENHRVSGVINETINSSPTLRREIDDVIHHKR